MTDQSNRHVRQVPPGAQLLGREWLGFDQQSRSAALCYYAKPEFANRHGTVQGGFLAAMLDSATGQALLAELPPELTAVTMSLETTFVRPASLGALAATARVTARDDQNAIVEAQLVNADRQVVARGTAKLRILSRKQ